MANNPERERPAEHDPDDPELTDPLGAGSLEFRHSLRFRRVAMLYPARVSEAYGGDLKRAAADTDEAVAATVQAWELANGLTPKNWPAIGRAESLGPRSVKGRYRYRLRLQRD
jgi:hypothetical protein